MRTCIFLILLFLFGLSSTGCFNTKRVEVDRDVPGQPYPPLPSDDITGVYLKSGQRLRLYKASYTMVEEGLVTSRNRIPMVISPKEVNAYELRTTRPEAVRVEALGNRKVTELILTGNVLVQFDQEGGRYDPGQGAIVGTRRDQPENPTSIPLNRINEIRVTEPDVLTEEEQNEAGPHLVQELVVRVPDGLKILSVGTETATYERNIPVVKGQTLGIVGVLAIPTREIAQVETTQFSPEKTALAVIGIPLLIVAGAAVIFVASSCPYVYSHDGAQFVLDAEPLGGATAEVFKRADFSRLEHLRPQNGAYQLLVRNANDETQFIDELKLVVVDHPEGTRVVPDRAGTMHVFSAPAPPSRAFDEHGQDFTERVAATDDWLWQSEMPADTSYRSKNLKHALTFAFPKPEGATEASLVVHGGISPWSAALVRTLLELRGDQVDAWYEALNSQGPELAKMWMFMEREELFFLKCYVKKGDTWAHVGFIPGGGPVVTEDRLIKLDLSGVEGDTVHIRINPPVGHWNLDHVGIAYEGTAPAAVTELTALSATDHREKDLSEWLHATDGAYYVMPETGDWARITFEVPPMQASTERTVFLKTSGYYQLHLTKEGPEQTALLEELVTKPGRVVEFSLDQYMKAFPAQKGTN